jgi:hypothetical protein
MEAGAEQKLRASTVWLRRSGDGSARRSLRDHAVVTKD